MVAFQQVQAGAVVVCRRRLHQTPATTRYALEKWKRREDILRVEQLGFPVAAPMPGTDVGMK
jgi:hypothetical protein